MVAHGNTGGYVPPPVGNSAPCPHCGSHVGCPCAWTQPSYFVPPPVEPKECIGRAHVFDCDHVERCRCGKIRRVVEAMTAVWSVVEAI